MAKSFDFPKLVTLHHNRIRPSPNLPNRYNNPYRNGHFYFQQDCGWLGVCQLNLAKHTESYWMIPTSNKPKVTGWFRILLLLPLRTRMPSDLIIQAFGKR